MAQAESTVEHRERRKAGAFRLPLTILPQPDETTCGPTCLHAVFRYWGEEEPLADIVARSHRFEHGGTLAVFLACDALRKGYRATIYTYNITVFDPTWFSGELDIAVRLERQRRLKPDFRRQHATTGYLVVLRLGGELCFAELNVSLVHGLLRRRLRVITGPSSTYFYGAARETDDGTTDPYQRTPYEPPHAYWIGVEPI